MAQIFLHTTPRPNNEGDRQSALIVPTNAIMAATEAINSAAAATSSSFPSLSLSLASFLSISSCGSALLSARPSSSVRRPPFRHCRLFQAARAPAKYHQRTTSGRGRATNLFGRSTRITNGYKSTSSVPSPRSRERGKREIALRKMALPAS